MQNINQTLGQYSELFMLLAALAYTVGFLAFTWDLVKSSRRIREIEAGLAESAKDRELVLAGAVAGGRRGKASADGAPTGSTADDAMDYQGERRSAARIAVALTIVAAVIHAVAVVTRGVAAGRVPWGNMYEFCTTGGLVVAVVFLLVLTRKDLRFLGTFVIGLVVVMLCAATIGFPTPVANLVPALQSYWLIIHVSVAVAASALFTLTFAMSVLQLIQASRVARLASGGEDRLPFMRLVPSALSLENLSYRINAIAFVMWTFTLMAGAIWAEKAWGRYWGWDTKEVWTFVIWVVYAGYLHARATRGWTGTRAAWLSIVGYLCIVFNFTIVNIYFSGLHSYAGV
ncbi:cytochrome C biogenesis protein [Arthrobacter sp. Soil782]|uniref:c-type cytochrome biogenesis protein CcsB n=1 Tax=Arthrobacter sp. Soil782 TaxID=1736410 RepID=UPI0006F9013C|nr:c-type cytochrome biogenesis protein CcsB [Arthrobacter sp. Soil782]KRF08254.1 cytochrome C biogenesis protein [Arthrobacter sp. Soil782]